MCLHFAHHFGPCFKAFCHTHRYGAGYTFQVKVKLTAPPEPLNDLRSSFCRNISFRRAHSHMGSCSQTPFKCCWEPRRCSWQSWIRHGSKIMLAIVLKSQISAPHTSHFSTQSLRPPWCLCGESSYSSYIQPLWYHLFAHLHQRGLPWSFVVGRAPGSDLCKCCLYQSSWCVHCTLDNVLSSVGLRNINFESVLSKGSVAHSPDKLTNKVNCRPVARGGSRRFGRTPLEA